MNIEKYINSLPQNEKEIIQQFRKIILETDKTVTEELGKIMSIDNTLNYNQDGVFKYGLAITSRHISFHSMVMYANPILIESLKEKLMKVTFQKGCINFNTLADFPVSVFKQHLKASAKIDFLPVINHYKNRK